MTTIAVWVASVRWLHILAGITWIGLLYYFNFVQAWSFPKMEAAARTNATQILLPRALLWFRWAALVTFLAGLTLIMSYGASRPGYYTSNSFYLISVGALMGTIMFINVWGIIWPNQKRIIEATNAVVAGGTAPPDQPKWARRAFLASRTNTMLSIPMVFFMVAAPFLGALAH
ncbi:MAG TPA: urate hydroxylase PuuD [Chloroflexota bacterium]|nr:urate hydroxylase PuuD [Chloroflexota bacterium]